MSFTQDKEKFIEMVKERRPLYDKTRPECSDRDIKERCWREIAGEYGAGTTGKIALCCFSRCSSVDDVCCFTVEQVKEEWRRLRTKFVKKAVCGSVIKALYH